MEIQKTRAALEAILFAAGAPVPLRDLARAAGHDEDTVRKLLNAMAEERRESGVRIVQAGDSWQLRTNPEFFWAINALAEAPPKRPLTQPILETLAIIAYRQPVTKGEIEKIRGVEASHAVNKLVEYDLVCEKGRDESVGRPILFGTTERFLTCFGLSGLGDLPPLSDKLDELRRQAEREVYRDDD
ncbi:MAG: SMC-Scp complex subunit ScpB [Clostridiales bacterium]|jgi:segregation and condensation protein B|nr:SMC-Scp complex subunit ScpB [Clostridiales bacterium]